MSTRRSTGLWSAWVGPSTTPPVTITRPVISAAIFFLIVVYDSKGRPLGELQTHGRPDVIPWKVDGYSTINLLLSPTISTQKLDLVTPGNRVVIFSSTGLPPWAGVIDVPIEKTKLGILVTLYSAEYLLTWALTPRYILYEGDRATDSRRLLIDLMEKSETLTKYGIVPPYWIIPTGSEETQSVEVEFAYSQLDQAIETLRGLDARLHYFLRPIEGDTLLLEMVAYRDALSDGASIPHLIETRNFAQVSTLDQGPILNEILTAASGADLSDPATQVSAAFDLNSSARFGLRRRFAPIAEGTTGGRSLYEWAQGLLVKSAFPRRRFRGLMLDLPPARFHEIGLGKRIIFEDGVTPELNVSILGIEWNAQENTLTLVVDYVEELDLWPD